MTAENLVLGGKRSATFLVICMLLAIVPLSPASAQDQGTAENLQAQDIVAIFNPNDETTTVSWRNIDAAGAFLQGLFDAKYHVYRHYEPINQTNILSLNPFESVIACNANDVQNNPFDCRGISGTHTGHSVSFQVPPGVNASYYYAIVTEHSNGTYYYDLDHNASNLYEPVVEITTPILTPYNLQGEFDPATSITSLSWVNYNDINNILPETGDDAYKTRVYRTDYPISRANGVNLLQEIPVAELEAGVSTVDLVIEAQTDRDVYYSITYLLPNWTMPGIDYEDVRFLSNNAMGDLIQEDNMAPLQVNFMTANFIPDEIEGDGITRIQWDDVQGEEGESYRIYVSGVPFNNTMRSDVQLLATIQEGVEAFDYNVPVGTLGNAYYCITTVDQYGVFDSNTTSHSCDGPIFEDAFNHWIAEPTNVKATFLGDKTTRVTWEDQMGVEGERYHVWFSNYLVTGTQFQENQSIHWLGTVSDSVGFFDVTLEDDILRDNAHYFVTTEALYGHQNGTYHYTELVQNYDGPISEDTRAPEPARIKEGETVGELNLVALEWFNEQEKFESYTVWRHFGTPFGEEEDDLSDVSAEGWELVDGPIYENNVSSNTFIRNLPLENNVDRDVWYAVTITDQYGNNNGEVFAGLGGNAIKINEDTKPPVGELLLFDDEGVLFDSPSLVAGSFRLTLQMDEYLQSNPLINITTTTGSEISDGEVEMSLAKDNLQFPELGPEYSFQFVIDSSDKAGPLLIKVTFTDEAGNTVTQEWTDRAIDAKDPTVTIFSPSAGTDGSKYLYGNKINLLAGAEDDVKITSFQYKFTYHYGGKTGSSSSSPWSDAVDVTDLEGDGSSLVMDIDFTAGNFEPGEHKVFVKAIDSAGNQVTKNVLFVVDFCSNRLDGTTSCIYVEATSPPEEPEVITPGFSDPPFVIVWVLAGFNVLALIVALMVIKTGMSGPKKKKRGDDDDEEDEDWMSEFIGTSQDLDMASITGTEEKKEEPKEEEKKESADPLEDEDDPFAINVVQRKTRRKKKAEPEPEEDEVDVDSFFDDDDDDDDDEEEEEAPAPKKKRAVGRRPAQPRNAPKRKVGRRPKSDE